MLRAGVLPGCLFWKQAGDSGRGCRWWGKYTGGGGPGGPPLLRTLSRWPCIFVKWGGGINHEQCTC